MHEKVLHVLNICENSLPEMSNRFDRGKIRFKTVTPDKKEKFLERSELSTLVYFCLTNIMKNIGPVNLRVNKIHKERLLKMLLL